MGNNTEDGYVEIERTRDGFKKVMKIEDMINAVNDMKINKKDIE